MINTSVAHWCSAVSLACLAKRSSRFCLSISSKGKEQSKECHVTQQGGGAAQRFGASDLKSGGAGFEAPSSVMLVESSPFIADALGTAS